MTTSLTLTSDLKFTWEFQNILDLATARDQNHLRQNDQIADGTGADQADQIWHDRRRLTPSTASDLLDLAGSLTNVFGQTVTFATVRGIMIINKGVPDASPATAWTVTSGEDIDVGGAAANPFTSLFDGSATAKVTIRSGGTMIFVAPADGYAVTAGSADILQIALDGAGADVEYDIVIWGTAA